MGLVQQATNFNLSSPSSLVVTMTSAPTSGNTILCFVCDSFGNSSPLPVTSIVSTNTTWTQDAAFTSSAVIREELWHGAVSGTGGTTITITLTGPVSQVSAACTEWSGLLTPIVFDGSTFNNGTAVTASTGALSTAGSSDLVFVGAYNAAGFTSNPPAPYTALTAANALRSSYNFGAASGSQTVANWGTISVHLWLTLIAAYQITGPAAGGPPPNIMMMGVGR